MALPRITATGNLGRDPELRFTQSGKPVCNLTVACNETRKDDAGQWQTISTTWLDVSLWGDDAETAAGQLEKGQKVTVSGVLAQREYEAKDGTKRTAYEIKHAQISVPLQAAKQAAQRPAQQAAAPNWGNATSSDQPPF